LECILSVIQDLRAQERDAEVEIRELKATRDEHKASGNARAAAAAQSNLDAAKDAQMVLRERIEQIEAQNERMARAAAAIPAGVVTSEPNPVYRKDNAHEVSYFRDIARAGLGGAQGIDARERLAQSQERALSTGTGAGGQFAPPLWLVEDFVELARPGRVTADSVAKQDLPAGVSSVNLPKVATGSSTAVQATQNVAVSQTDLTTSSVSSGITTIAGKQIVSLQLLNQSGIPFDQVILGDLARDYAVQLDKQVISGTGANGQLQGITTLSGVNAVTYTTSTPKVVDGTTAANSFYNVVVKAAAAIKTARYVAPSVIIMHPNRWAWIQEALDNNARPIVAVESNAYNVLGAADAAAAQGATGSFAGIPVFTDANIPVNGGTGTNQDEVIVMRGDDLWLYESPIQSESFDATYADQVSVLFRVVGFSAFLPNRYLASISLISGTGLVAPSL
jgi:HK97 family phage major capsid protein